MPRLHPPQRADREVRADDAAADALALALALAARAVGLHALGEEEAHALVAEDLETAEAEDYALQANFEESTHLKIL